MDDLNNEIQENETYFDDKIEITEVIYNQSNNSYQNLSNISKTYIINGNGEVLNASLLLYLNKNNESNLKFILINTTLTDFNKISNYNNVFYFINSQVNAEMGDSLTNSILEPISKYPSYSDIPSKLIFKKTKSIVGNSNGLKAAKKIAFWIKKNIHHKKRKGFYQSPDITLTKKRGNCCSQTELFLLMCKAVGVDKKHKLYFIHVGKMKFRHRHFFAMIDNICVDVDGSSKNPWKVYKKRKVYRIIEYPSLPLV